MNAFFLVVNKYVPCRGWVLDACIRQREGERDTSKDYLGTCECEPRKGNKKTNNFCRRRRTKGLDLLQSWFHVFHVFLFLYLYRKSSTDIHVHVHVLFLF